MNHVGISSGFHDAAISIIDTQQVEFSHAVKPIVDHNLTHYQTLGPIEANEFIERFGV